MRSTGRLVPASPRSFSVTAAYRQRVTAIRGRVQAQARREWPTIEGFDTSRWPDRMAVVVAGAQTEAVRAAAGYLTAYLTSETGWRARAITVDSRRYAGVSRDGRPLTEALQSPLIGVRAALADGKTAEVALAYGLQRATRMVGIDVDHAHRVALTDTIEADDRFAGWQRATAGTCGACMALSGQGGGAFRVHPGCSCTPQPVVRGVEDRFPLPSATDLFARLTPAEQDAQFGQAKAEALRTGAIAFADLIAVSEIETAENFVTEAPLDAAE